MDKGAAGMGLQRYVLATRPWSFLMTIGVVLTGFLLALYLGYKLDVLLAFLALLGSVLLHASINVINDYYDYRRGVDRPGVGTAAYRPHPIIEGLLSERATIALGYSLGLTALAIGLYISLQARPLAIVFGILGFIVGVQYSAPPLGLKYRGLGELGVLAAFGPIMMYGAYYVASGSLDWRVLLVSLSMGAQISAVLLANNLRDADTDREAGIVTLPVLVGRDKGMMVYAGLLLASHALLVAAIIVGALPYYSLIALATLPATLKLVKQMRASIPVDADPRTAKLFTQYSALVVASLIASRILP